jgi:hypothetical protein
MLRGKFIAIIAYVKKPETSQINNLMMHLKLLEKQEQTKPKISRWREIRSGPISMRLKPKNYTKNTETKSWFFEKINKINKPLVNMTKWRREKTQMNKIRDEKGDITTNTSEIQRIIGEYFKTYIKVS